MNGPFATLSILDAAVLAIGIALGLAIGYFAFPAIRQAKRLREELEGLRREHEVYKAGVSEHFQKTADLVGEMTKSYAAVYDHLAGGARRYCGDALADNALAFGPQLTILARPESETAAADEGVVIETRASAEQELPPVSPQSSQQEFSVPAQESETATADVTKQTNPPAGA
ncbi:MAG: DUF1043 family protein [Deltaproteobacteria bacterium]|nr:DUF1043 family protein [Deltaproteobacteria bacterium]